MARSKNSEADGRVYRVVPVEQTDREYYYGPYDNVRAAKNYASRHNNAGWKSKVKVQMSTLPVEWEDLSGRSREQDQEPEERG